MPERLARRTAVAANGVASSMPSPGCSVSRPASRGAARTRTALKAAAVLGSSSMVLTAAATPCHTRDGSRTASTSGRPLLEQAQHHAWGRSQAQLAVPSRLWHARMQAQAMRLNCSSSTADISLHAPSKDSRLAPRHQAARTTQVPHQQVVRGQVLHALPSQHVLNSSSACDLTLPGAPLSSNGVQLLHTAPLEQHQHTGSATSASNGFAGTIEMIRNDDPLAGLHHNGLGPAEAGSAAVGVASRQFKASSNAGPNIQRRPAVSSAVASSNMAPQKSRASHHEVTDEEALKALATARSPAEALQGAQPSPRVSDEDSWEWQAAPMLSPTSPHEPSFDSAGVPSQPPRSVPEWAHKPRVLSALLTRTHRLGRLEALLDQCTDFLNARHIAIALGVLPRIADLSRAAEQRQEQEKEPRQQRQQQQGGGLESRNTGSATSNNRHSQPSSSGEGVDASPQGQSLEQQQRRGPSPPQQDGPVQVGVCYPAGRQHTFKSRERRVRVRNLGNRLAQSFLRFLREGEYGPHDLAIAVWSLGRVGCRPSPAWQSTVLRACQKALPDFEPRQLSYMLWGAAVMGVEPSHGWLRAVRRQVLASAQAGTLDAIQTAVCLWAVARLASRSSAPSQVAWEGQGSGSGGEWHGASPSSLSFRSSQDEDSDDLDAEETSSLGGASGLALAPPPRPAWAQQAGSRSSSAPVIAPGWVDAYLSSAVPRLPDFETRHLCMVLSALVWLRHNPPDTLLQPVLRLALQRTFSPGAAASLLWSLARLRHRPPKTWLQAFTFRLGPLVPHMSCQELSMSLWALAALQAEPEEEVLQQYEAVSHGKLEDFSPQGLAVMVWAMARLGFRPSVMWMERLAQASQAQLDSFSPQAQSLLVWGMATLHYSPHPHPTWLQRFSSRTSVRLSASSPQSLANTILAMAKLSTESAGGGRSKGGGKAVSAPWITAFMAASGQLLKRQKLAAGAVQAEAVQAARRSPQAQQQRQQQGQVQQQEGQGQTQAQVQQSVLSLPVSEQPPVGSSPASSSSSSADPDSSAATPSSSASAAAAAATERSERSVTARAAARASAEAAAAAAALPAAEAAARVGFNAQELTNVLWALSKLRMHPGAAWLATAECVAQALVPLMSAHNTAVLLYALATLPRVGGALLSGELLEAAVARLVALLQQPNAVKSQDVANSLWALAKLGYEPDPASLEALLEAGEKLLPTSNHAEQAQLLWALCRLGVVPPPRLLPTLVQVSAPQLGSMPYASLVMLLACMSRLDYRPPEAWVQQAAAAASRAATSGQVQGLPAAQRSQMADWIDLALDKLGHTDTPGDESAHMWLPAQLVGAGGAGE